MHVYLIALLMKIHSGKRSFMNRVLMGSLNPSRLIAAPECLAYMQMGEIWSVCSSLRYRTQFGFRLFMFSIKHKHYSIFKEMASGRVELRFVSSWLDSKRRTLPLDILESQASPTTTSANTTHVAHDSA